MTSQNSTILHLNLKTIKNVSLPFQENHPSVLSDTLSQCSSNADPPAFVQQPTQGSNNSTNAQPAHCYMFTSCRHVTTTLCPLQHASFMQITWTVPLTSSFSHTTATWHAQHMYSSLASLAFSAAALNLHVDHLGSAYGRLITSLKALLHAHHHAEAI